VNLRTDLSVPRMVPSGDVFRLVFVASVRELIRRRRLVFIGLAALLPLLLVFMWRAFGMEIFDATAVFSNLVGTVYLGGLVYLVGLAFGVPTVHDEVEGRTITYLFTRPISKIAVYAGRLAAVQLLGGVVLAFSLVVCFAVMVLGNPGALSAQFVKVYVNHVWLILFATIVLTGLFSIFGILFRRPLVWGFFYWIAWEGFVSKAPGRLQTWTLDFHLRNLMMRDDDVQSSVIQLLRNFLVENPDVSPWTSMAVLVIAFLGFTVIGGWIFARKQYVIN
jgi:hypothetical protein